MYISERVAYSDTTRPSHPQPPVSTSVYTTNPFKFGIQASLDNYGHLHHRQQLVLRNLGVRLQVHQLQGLRRLVLRPRRQAETWDRNGWELVAFKNANDSGRAGVYIHTNKTVTFNSLDNIGVH